VTRAVDDNLVHIVRNLPIDTAYIRHVVERLTSIGSSPLGYRNTGTPEDAAVADFVGDEMRRFGLVDVAVEDVEVDAWRFFGAGVSVSSDAGVVDLEASSFGGIPPTGRAGVTARVVDVGDPKRTRLDALDLSGALALVDWQHKAIGPSVFAAELARRGAVGVIVNCPPGGPWFQAEGALGAFDSRWLPGSPPAIFIRKEDAVVLRELLLLGGATGTMHLDATTTRGASGHNVVGYLPGREPGPIVVGAHHDAWFRGAFDNTSGVAALLAIAKALVESGHRPRHTLCFTSRTAEEYGVVDSQHDWCIGAWRQIDDTHPEWQTESPFSLVLEASGHPELRTIVEAPVELLRWARAVAKAADAEGWMPTGYRVAPPVAGTEQWPFLVSGVPGVASYAWETSFADTAYHTQLDTLDSIDPDLVTAQARLYALLLLSADRDPDATLDHRARARELARIAAQQDHRPLAEAAEIHRTAQGRAAFTTIGRSLFALDAHDAGSYPHDQASRDLEALSRAIAAVDAGRPKTAATHLSKVGINAFHPYLSDGALETYADGFTAEAASRSWGSASHLTPSPLLWQEIASLRGHQDATPLGPWLRASLVEARDRTTKLLHRRLDVMARSVSSIPTEGQAT
jgi:hypothetical protein